MNTIKLIQHTKTAPAVIGIYLDKYDPKIVGFIKSRPGARYNPDSMLWYIPNDPLAQSTIETLQGIYNFNVEEGVLTHLSEPTRLTIDLNASNLPLYPYQREIVEFLLNNPYSLNASFVGSGKTLTSLAVCDSTRAHKILIIAPKSVVLQWSEQEIPKWIPNAKIVAIGGSMLARNKLYKNYQQGYMVMGYETARIDIELIAGIDWDIIITDEAHRLANPSTKLYKALKKLKSARRIALTATPVMNHPLDMFGVINWLNPGVLGNYYQFMNRYIIKDFFGGIKNYKNLAELAARCSPYIIRKTLDEVDLQLPDYTETIIPVELSPSERKLYDQIKSELLFDIEKSLINKIETPVMLQLTIVKMGKLFELCDSMELLGEEVKSTKLDVLKEHLEGVLQNGQKAIIITRFSRMAEILKREISGICSPLIITGATSNRQEILNKFTEPDHKVLIGPEAIAQGLNLQVANILYNYDSAWNPAKMEQRAGRVYRNGQTKPVFIYNMVVNKSVEGWLQKKLVTKQELSASLLPKTIAEIREILQ